MQDAQQMIEYVKCAEVKFGRSITVVAATKTVSPEQIAKVASLGITELGENRVQEYLTKRDVLQGFKWHIIGALQTNKVKYVAGQVECIQSLDRITLADELEKRLEKIGAVQKVLIEVNICNEENKSGVAVENLSELCAYVSKCKHLDVRGLMSVPPTGADENIYKSLNELYKKMRDIYGYDTLSVGMSQDYRVAIENGSTMIRPGRLLFGERNTRTGG